MKLETITKNSKSDTNDQLRSIFKKSNDKFLVSSDHSYESPLENLARQKRVLEKHCLEPTFKLKKTFGGKKFEVMVSDNNQVHLDGAVGELQNVHTILGDLYASLPLQSNVKFALNLYGELFIPFHSIANALSCHSACGQKIEISREENIIIEEKVDALTKILKNVTDDISDLERTKKTKLINNWIESITTLKDQNNNSISNDAKIQLLVGVFNGIAQTGKTAMSLLESGQQLCLNPKINAVLGKIHFAALTKVLIPAAILTTMSIGIKSFHDVYTNEQKRLQVNKETLPNDISKAINKRMTDKSVINTVNLFTNVAYGILAVKSLALTHGFHYIVVGLAGLIGVGNQTNKVCNPPRTLTLENHLNLSSQKNLLDFYRYIDRDFTNISNSIKFYKNKPGKLSTMYALSETNNNIDFLKTQIKYLKDEMKNIKSIVRRDSQGPICDVLKDLHEHDNKLYKKLIKEQNRCQDIREGLIIFMNGLQSPRQNKELSCGLATFVDYIRNSCLEEKVLSSMNSKILDLYLEKTDNNRENVKVKYEQVREYLSSKKTSKLEFKNANLFLKEYLRCSANVIQSEWFEPKRDFRNEVTDLIIQRTYNKSKSKKFHKKIDI